MKAVAYQQCLPIAHAESLLDVDLPEPAPGPHDLLVEIRAVAANPLDTKMRAQAQPAPGHCKVLGWDASGMVRAVGADKALGKPAPSRISGTTAQPAVVARAPLVPLKELTHR